MKCEILTCMKLRSRQSMPRASVLVMFSHCCDKMPKKNKVGELTWGHDLSFFLNIQNIMLEKAWQRKWEVPGHLVSVVRKLRLMNTSVLLVFFILGLQPSDVHCGPLPLSYISIEIPSQALSRQSHLRLR